MDFAVIYLARRFVYRIAAFFRHWYFDGSREFKRRFMSVTMALRSSLPAVVRAIAIAAIAVMFAVVYIAWLAVAIIILFYAAKNI
jgi:hypothetical protein